MGHLQLTADQRFPRSIFDMKIRLLLFFLLLAGTMGFAQQDSQFTEYMYNTVNINPAYAGSRGSLNFFGLHRTQWVGLDGAPVTNSASVNAPLGDSKFGIGVSFVNDRIGPTSENTGSVDLSYGVQTSQKYKLAFGLKASGNLFDLNANKLNPEDQNDPTLQGLHNKLTGNLGAGVYFYSDKSYVGFSIPNLIQNDHYSDSDVSINKEKMNLYLIGGYVFDLGPDFKLKPAFLTKLVAGAPLQIDISANLMFADRFILGGAYRVNAAFSAMAGFQITNTLFIGYAYDHDTTTLQKYNSGSHEIFLRYEIFGHYNRIISPRFF
jgi:type IX secretion system PorP/SprF family membrane protein